MNYFDWLASPQSGNEIMYIGFHLGICFMIGGIAYIIYEKLSHKNGR